MRKPITAIIAAVALTITGCRSEADGVPVAQLGAEQRLASAAGVGDGADDSRPEVTLRRLSTGDDYDGFHASALSPDGRYVSLIDWATFNLAVRDLETGELHLLTNVHHEQGKPWEGAGVSVFSPDGRRILYGWEYSPDLQLRVVDFEPDELGVPRVAEPTVLFHNPEFYPYYLFDWSPDGGQVLAKVYTTGNTNQLALISTADGTYRALRSFDWREPLRAEFSPDGRYVAYDFLPELDSPNRDVFVLSLDGTYETTVVDGPAVDRLLGWHPDEGILFHSDRGGTPGVWRIPTSDGRPAGSAELVRGDMWGVEPLGFADDRFYYGVDVDPRRLYTAAVDFGTGQLAGAPVAVDDPAWMRIWGWDWSPDGKFLAYAGSTAGARGSMIVVRSDAGKEVRSIRLDLEGSWGRLRWAPDGKALIVYARDDKGRRGFQRIDLETGSYTTILRNDQLEEPALGDFDVSPDGRTLWFATIHLARPVRRALVGYDLQSGDVHPNTPVEWLVRPEGPLMDLKVAVSPDGAKLALIAPDTTSRDRWVGTIPVAGGLFTRLARVEGLVQGLEWTPDGRSVVFSTLDTESWPEGQWTTWILPADGGEVRPLELMEHVQPQGMKLHPDGGRIAFLAGESRGEVWVMEGLGTGGVAPAPDIGSR